MLSLITFIFHFPLDFVPKFVKLVIHACNVVETENNGNTDISPGNFPHRHFAPQTRLPVHIPYLLTDIGHFPHAIEAVR